MKKVFTASLIICFVLLASSVFGLVAVYSTAYAEGEHIRDVTVMDISVTAGDKTINYIYSDPVDYYEDSASGYLNAYEIRYENVGATDSVMYTPLYPDTTTGRVGNVVEYVCEPSGSTFTVTKINANGDGTTYIPVGGFVLSLRKDMYADFAEIGDTVTLGGNKVTIATKAVESSAHRVVVDNTNTTRSAPMVVYYDYQFGSKTGTNVFGTEMTCEYDFDLNTFVVTSFRNFGMGDDSGSDIPDNSFVLSAYGEGFRQLLVRDELFSVNDHVKMVGFDFIRFGGTVYGEYDFVNPTPQQNPAGMETETSPFPAYRGENQTIIYKYGWSYNGSVGTGTNIYGYEAAVDANGVVVEMNVNVSKIPENGYVISGHGAGRDFIRSNIVLGATVQLDEENKTYSISTTLNSYYENLVLSVNSAVNNAQSKMNMLYDLDTDLLNSCIEQVQVELQSLQVVKEDIEAALEEEGLTPERRLSLLMHYNDSQLQIERLRQQLITASAESRPVSARAVWHRPVEMTYEAIEQNISTYHEIGINLVFVETLYNGYSTFRSDVADFPYNPKLSESYANGDIVYNDYLSAFAACCAEYGIEVHAWVENFYVGTLNTVEVIQNHPDWLLYNDDGTIYQRNEGGAYIFIDPANKEVQDTLIAYYNDLLEKVPQVVGLNLDYIRYPVSDFAEDTGYTMAAMKGFYEQKGLTFSAAQLADREKMANKFRQLFDIQYMGSQQTVDANYNEWVQYRTDVVTEFVRRIKNEVKDTKDIMLSTAVFASLSESKDAKKQDWQTWFTNGWIDIATPMAYYNDASDVLTRVNEMILLAGNNCYYYSGLATSYSGLPAWQNKEHIEASYSAGANGYVIFCSTQIIGHDDVQQALLSGVNSKQAVLPHASVDKVLKGYFDDIIDKAQRIYIPAGGMTTEQRQQLAETFAEIQQMTASSAVDIFKIQQAVKEAVSSASSFAKGYSRQRITEQLNQLIDLLDTKISLQLIADGDWNPEEDNRRPTVTEDGIIANPPITEPDDKPIQPDDEPTPPEQPNNTLAVVLGVTGGVVVIAGAVVSVVLIKRKKR